MPTHRISAGRTPPGQGWQQFQTDAGVYIDVDTTPHRFGSTPVYVTALHGNSTHWATTGGSSVYSPTATNFRVYVRWSDGRPLAVADAEDRRWHIQWIGVETTG
jgi:hypothetical protein